MIEKGEPRAAQDRAEQGSRGDPARAAHAKAEAAPQVCKCLLHLLPWSELEWALLLKPKGQTAKNLYPDTVFQSLEASRLPKLRIYSTGFPMCAFMWMHMFNTHIKF